jgi:LuxR family transcriptional regulator, quorum-sensing system regulator CviR
MQGVPENRDTVISRESFYFIELRAKPLAAIARCIMHDKSERILPFSSESPGLSNCLSSCDAIKLLEIINKCVSCEEINDFKVLYQNLHDLFPFDFAHAFLGHRDSVKGIVIEQRVNISFPEEWLSEFLQNYLQVSVVVRENFRNYGLQKWSDSKKRFGEKKEILSLSHNFGMREGYSSGVSPSLSNKNGSMFCFSGSFFGRNIRYEAILKLVIPHLHLALMHIFNIKQPNIKQPNVNSVGISFREKEVLNWLKEGKTSWDISVILGISERTVDFHVNNIRQKLGATNRPQAVALAARRGLIEFS